MCSLSTISAGAQKLPGVFLVSQQPLLHAVNPLVQSVREQYEAAKSRALTSVEVLKNETVKATTQPEQIGLNQMGVCHLANLQELVIGPPQHRGHPGTEGADGHR